MGLYGYHPPTITSPFKGNTEVRAVEDHLGNQQEVLNLNNNYINITVKGNLNWGIGYF